jgi:2-dehydropantoate 2-reductase
MRHAVLGVGGVGGFVGAVLAHGGERVTLLLRPETLAAHPDSLTLESGLGGFTAACARAARLEEEVDVLWVTPKATQLEAALALVPEPGLARRVVPLLNGVDHVTRLRERFGAAAVVPGTIAAELERAAPGRIVHRSAFARFGFSAAGRAELAGVGEILTRFDCAVTFEADELTLLWRKLVMLAPMALATTAAARPLGEVRGDREWGPRLEAAAREASAVGAASGARVNGDEVLGMLRGMPATLRSSMQKDVAAGRPPELDAIGGPILRGGRAHGIAVPATEYLVAEIASRAVSR